MDRCRRSDVLHVPKANSRDLTSVLIEVQHAMDMRFIKRMTKYCSHIYDNCHIEPSALRYVAAKCVLRFRNYFQQRKNHFLCNFDAIFWTKTHFVLSGNTIANSLDGSPLEPLVALMCVLSSHESSLLSLGHRTDPTVQMVCTIPKTAFYHEVRKEANVDVFVHACKHFRQQLDCTRMALDQVASDRKRARTYLADGIEYADLCINRYIRKQPSASTIPLPPMLPEGVHSISSREAARAPPRVVDGPQQ